MTSFLICPGLDRGCLWNRGKATTLHFPEMRESSRNLGIARKFIQFELTDARATSIKGARS